MIKNTGVRVFILGAIFLSACASPPGKIQKSYVSPLQYQSYNCNQVGGEMARVSRRTGELHGILKKKADDDAIQMTIGMFLFWPALLFLEGGDGPEALEYARMIGEFDALEKFSVQKECDIDTTEMFASVSRDNAKKKQVAKSEELEEDFF